MEQYSTKKIIQTKLDENVKINDLYYCLVKEDNEINFRFCTHDTRTSEFFSLSKNKNYYPEFFSEEDAHIVRYESYLLSSFDDFLKFYAQNNFNIYLMINDLFCNKVCISTDALTKTETKINALRNKNTKVKYKEEPKLLRESNPTK